MENQIFSIRRFLHIFKQLLGIILLILKIIKELI